MKDNLIYTIVGLFCFFIILLSFLLPFFNQYGYITGLDGIAGRFDHMDIWTSCDPITGFIYGLGDILCHQEELRSLILNGSQMPFCARDISIMIGIIIALLVWKYMLRCVDILNSKVLTISLIFVILTVLEWCIEHYYGIDIMFFRVVFGIITGIGIGTLLTAYEKYQFGKLLENR